MTGWHKLLIAKGVATVAEERQGGTDLSLPNNKNKRQEAQADSMLVRNFAALVAQTDNAAIAFACRAFETLHRPELVSYNLNRVCDCVNGMSSGARRTLPHEPR